MNDRSFVDDLKVVVDKLVEAVEGTRFEEPLMFQALLIYLLSYDIAHGDIDVEVAFDAVLKSLVKGINQELKEFPDEERVFTVTKLEMG